MAISLRQRSLLLLLLALAPSSSQAFGGFFGRPAPERQVSQSGDAIVFGLADNKVQLQVKIDYESTASTGNSGGDNSNTQEEEFGWILPLPAVPTNVSVGSSLLFEVLFQETLPRFVLDIQDGSSAVSATTSRQGTSVPPLEVEGQVCDATSISNQDCPIQGPTRGTAGAIQVWAEGHAGWLEYKVLEGSKEDVMDWVTENNFGSTNMTNLSNLLDYYDASGSVYVVLKVAPSSTKATASVQPLLIEYELPSPVNEGSQVVHKVPTLLSGATTADQPATLQVYFLTDQVDSRATPVNYLDVTLDDAFVDWVGCLSPSNKADECYYQNYKQRFADAITPVTNQTMTTEYAGPSSILLQKVGVDVALGDLELSATWMNYLRQLEDAGLSPIPAVQAILDQYIPPKSFEFVPPFQCAQWEHVYQPFRTASPSMFDCFEIFVPPEGWTWDPVGLTRELEANILLPARQAQALVDNSYQSLTRMYGLLVAPDKTPEPHFVLNTGKPQVGNVHTATARPICDLGSPSALEITIDVMEKEKMTFWQPALLQCPTWERASPKPVFTAADAAARVNSLASLFTAWGIGDSEGIQVPRENGLFLYNDIDTALQYGDALLGTLTRPEGDASNTEEGPGVPTSGSTHIAVSEPTDDALDAEAGLKESSAYYGRLTPSVVTVAAVAVVGFLPTWW